MTGTLFHAAPPSIGAIVSTTTTLGPQGSIAPRWPGVRITQIICFAILTFIFAGLPVSWIVPREGGIAAFLMGDLIAVALAIALTIYFTRVPDVVSYVGKVGLARYRRIGQRVEEEVMLFAQAVSLEETAVHVHAGGFYLFTNHVYRWRGDRGEQLFMIWVRSNERSGAPLPSWHPGQFARHAVVAWEPFERATPQDRIAQQEATARARRGRLKWRIALGTVGFIALYLLGSVAGAWSRADHFNRGNERTRALVAPAAKVAAAIEATKLDGLAPIESACAGKLEPGDPASLMVMVWPPPVTRDLVTPPGLFGRPRLPERGFNSVRAYQDAEPSDFVLTAAEAWDEAIFIAPWEWFDDRFVMYAPDVYAARYVAIAVPWGHPKESEYADPHTIAAYTRVLRADSEEVVCEGRTEVKEDRGSSELVRLTTDFGVAIEVREAAIKALCSAGGELLCSETDGRLTVATTRR